MNVKQMTVYFIMAVIAVITVFDFFVFNKGGTEATISWTIHTWAHKYPAMVFAAGFVCGHLFWQMKVPPKKEES